VKLNISHLPLLVIFSILVIFAGCSDHDPTGLPVARGLIDPVVFDDAYGDGIYFQAFAQTHITAVETDSVFAYGGSAADGARSLKFNIPPNGSSLGAYTGGVLTPSQGRDLADFNALTFYARSNVNITLDVAGFGNDNTGNSLYSGGRGGVSLNPNWTFVVVPLPDSSKLLSERGLLTFAESREPQYSNGYDIWLDEIRYAKLDNITNPRPSMPASDKQYFVGSTVGLNGTKTTFDVDGADVDVDHMPNYFAFESSNGAVASVTGGEVVVTGVGNATISAVSGDLPVEGAIVVTSFEAPAEPAAIPSRPADSVVSLYSSAYNDVPVDYWNGYWGGTTTEDGLYYIGDHETRMYSALNWVGIEFKNPLVDASDMTHFHLDVYAPFGTNFKVKFVSFNEAGQFATSQELTFDAESTPSFAPGGWVSLDIPLEGITFYPAFESPWSRIGQLVFATADAKLILVDNIYWHQ
jgi:hypothetical protein